MRFSTPLLPARLIRRYKRFLADIRLDDGTEAVAHIANPGSMLGLQDPGSRIWVERNDDPKKKLRYGWRLVDHGGGHFTGVDTTAANRVVAEGLRAGLIDLPHDTLQAEVAYGAGSRCDFLLTGPHGDRTWVEVKSVTLSRRPGLAEFPDSVTARGARHLRDLADRVQAGDRAVLLFLIQRTDCSAVALAADLDHGYALAHAQARVAGVETLAMDCRIDPSAITIGRLVPLKV